MKNYWYELDFWESEDWFRVEKDLSEISYCPGPGCLWLPMELTPLKEVRCVIMGQDPYPNPALAMGLCYSIPNLVRQAISPTLRNIFSELVNDLHVPYPTTTDLTPWAEQGVLLWNAIPTCKPWESMSHDWEEWRRLTREVILSANERNAVICCMGAVARGFVVGIDERSEVIETSHPSPRGCSFGSPSFRGSRVFSKINDYLGSNPIDWRLP